MRNLRTNQQIIFYKLYTGQTEVVDEYGNATGNFVPTYGALEYVRISVSPNRGSSDVDVFGNIAEYDRTMTTADTKCEINENSILWIKNNPASQPHDYIVKKRSEWKNSLLFAISEVKVSENAKH